MENKIVVLLDPYEYNGHSDIFKNRNKEQHYAFDYAFDENASQEEIFKHTVHPLIETVLDGFNCTVFAYGSTGAGKTYTMLGNENHPGIMPQTLKSLFEKVELLREDKIVTIKLWYLEIYNENLRDLINPQNIENIDIREDPQKGTSVSGITEVTVKKSQDIMMLLKKGNKNRSTESTNANEASSRSHAVLQLQVEIKEKNSGIQQEIKVSRFSMIDLAGSERASATQNKGIRLLEGANINRSLLTLGNCITALADCSEKGIKPHIPYRDSKLTRILKDSLGGNSKTVMIANVSPSAISFDDTYNTLKYANRAKNIKTNLVKNTYNVQHHIANYENIIINLKSEIAELKAKSLLVESNVVNNNVNNNFYVSNIFEKCVKELKIHLDEEVKIKEKIIQVQQDLEDISSSSPDESSLISSKSYDLITSNNSLTSKANQKQKTIEEVSEKEDLSQEKLLIEKELLNLTTQLNLLISKREEVIKSSYNKQMRDFYKEHIISILQAHDSKLSLMEKDKEEKYANYWLNKKNTYIKQLENQVNLRDKIIKEKNLVEEINLNHEIKSIKELKKLYRLPKIKQTDYLNTNNNLQTNETQQNKNSASKQANSLSKCINKSHHHHQSQILPPVINKGKLEKNLSNLIQVKRGNSKINLASVNNNINIINNINNLNNQNSVNEHKKSPFKKKRDNSTYLNRQAKASNQIKRDIDGNKKNSKKDQKDYSSIFPNIKDEKVDITETNIEDTSIFSNNNINFYKFNNKNNQNLNVTINNHNEESISQDDFNSVNLGKPQLKKKDMISHLHKRQNSPKV